MNANEERSGVAILGANGAPTKVNVGVKYSPGPLVTPVSLDPIQTKEGILVPTFGGATRMETVASRLLAGAMAHNTLLRCSEDPSYRKTLIDTAVVMAWETIGAASMYQGPDPVGEDAEGPEPSAAADAENNDAAGGDRDAQTTENREPIWTP